jgi:opacity protein-like surface antigen
MMRLISALMLILALSAGTAFAISGSAGGGLGATIPQGEFNDYTKTGFALMGFGILNPGAVPFMGIRFSGQAVLFEHESRDVILSGYPDADLTETYSNNLLKATLGLEFSANTGTLEPYGGAGIGVYYFESKTVLKNDVGTEVASNTLDSMTKFGYNLMGGLRLYLAPKIAIDFNAQYDIITDMEQYADDKLISFQSEFLSFFVGIHIPIGPPL